MGLKINKDPFVLIGDVMHQRFSPKKNQFSYPIYYIGLPLTKIDELDRQKQIAIDRFAFTSFYKKDHGSRKIGADLILWARGQLKKFNLHHNISHISLIAMPRVFGFVFNPVSFWLCFDQNGHLRVILYEVNNTFGQTHTYVCAHHDGAVISNQDWITSNKEFHVSPYLEREGIYKFRIACTSGKLAIWINYYDEKGNHILATALKGHLKALNAKTLSKSFWTRPLVTQKAISLIYWQALKLKTMGLKYLALPSQKSQRISFNSQSPRR